MSGIEAMSLLHHGGRLQNAMSKFGGKEQDWLDLSTGVSPWHYPVPEIPLSCWNRLPEEDDGLTTAADGYYAGHNALPVAGSQAAIQCLPKVLASKRGGPGIVLLPIVGYKEHERAWRKQGWNIEYYSEASKPNSNNDIACLLSENNDAVKAYYPTADQLSRCDALVVINPNNPAAHFIPRVTLNSWLVELSSRSAVLVVDEAFMDMTPEQSMLPLTNDHLIVLRSVGKFFGLAGVRAGFVYASKDIRFCLQIELGPWCLNGPAREVCKKALTDVDWQQMQIKRLNIASQRLRALLDELPGKVVGTDLFQTIYLADAPLLHKALCQQQVFTRLTDEQDALRFGLPVDENQWLHLTTAINSISQSQFSETNHGNLVKIFSVAEQFYSVNTNNIQHGRSQS